MGNTPFSFDDAEEIAEDFEDLIDTELTMPVTGTSVFMVDAVAVCPFDAIEKERFADEFYKTRDVSGALAGYTGSDYDVILLLTDADNESNYSYLGIRTYILEKGITYNFPADESHQHSH